jgi:hypothetical protein
MALGLSDHEIAGRLWMNSATTTPHVNRAITPAGLRNRTQPPRRPSCAAPARPLRPGQGPHLARVQRTARPASPVHAHAPDPTRLLTVGRTPASQQLLDPANEHIEIEPELLR